MASEPCEGCGDDVPIGGGISGIWSSDPEGTGGMTLEFEDGTEHFLCFDCIEELPDEPSAADVAALDEN
ncbi:hypothetical protein HWV23_09485 [Natronomonas halophila]|uniref:DUF7561 family protein n=1 Tax=Natronomonas halophila TaxID=2747817 RepID=UPI0015B3D071|nr:hypothetical protein [Natronomonas halophila]QLD85946.1 hypothetical protein HWV23_09485 [Natronomonas halophila]